MKSYEYFYKIILEREIKILDFSLLKEYLKIIKEEISEIEEKINNFEERKEIHKNQMDTETQMIRNQKNLLKKEMNLIEKEIFICKDEFQIIEKNKEKIKKKPSFLISINSKMLEIKHLNIKKTNVCQRCRFNCNLECKDSFNNLYKCFDGKFKCKNCPNKCSAKNHEIVSYKYGDYEYKTLDIIMEKYHSDEKNFSSSDLKISFAIQKIDEEIKDLEAKKESLNKTILKLDKDIEIWNKNEDENLININKRLNYEIESFNSYIKKEKDSLEKLKLQWYEEIFMSIIFSFLPKEKDYSLTPKPENKCIII